MTRNNGLYAISILKSVGGVVSSLGSNSFGGCGNGTSNTVIRVVSYANNYIVVYVNGIFCVAAFDHSITSGAPGVGVIGATGGNAILRADLGQVDNVAPNPVAPATISVMAFPNRVDFNGKEWRTIPMESGYTNVTGGSSGLTPFGWLIQEAGQPYTRYV